LSSDPDFKNRKLIECVPNFSEGRDPDKIQRIVDSVRGVPHVWILHVDSSADANRTVLTFAGPPIGVLEAGFRLAVRCAETIDMSAHSGIHPRIGSLDVFPFVPLRNASLSECTGLAERLAERVGNELKVPVYLYGAAARTPERAGLPAVRAGGYEGLTRKILMPEWKPDYGPAEFNPRAGAFAIGARNILVAYNVNLNKADEKAARKIAETIRESGSVKRDEAGRVVRDAHRRPVRILGVFKSCRAIGWVLDQRGKAQVSTNLTDYRITPPHVVYEECIRLAKKNGVCVTGSEVVGLIPLEALLMAGRHFRERGATHYSEAEWIDAAIGGLGLNDLYPFAPQEKILEYRLNRVE
jgi:glutamate formiminotransferase/formiminotetrahydrofolate cyclodeaminase